jgi:hypothetical protein
MDDDYGIALELFLLASNIKKTSVWCAKLFLALKKKMKTEKLTTCFL